MSADSKTQIVGTTGWAEQEREIERLNERIKELEDKIYKLKTQHEYEVNGLRALLQNEQGRCAKL